MADSPEVKRLKEKNKELRSVLKIFADKHRLRMLEDTQVNCTNGECRRAAQALEDD